MVGCLRKFNTCTIAPVFSDLPDTPQTFMPLLEPQSAPWLHLEKCLGIEGKQMGQIVLPRLYGWLSVVSFVWDEVVRGRKDLYNSGYKTGVWS